MDDDAAQAAATAHYGHAVELVREDDVLDTWFSSALWPFSTMGWPDQTEDLKRYHPTDLMITGRDILYLWVVRMIMTALEFEEEIPFKTVLVHPTVQTRDGKRMSKSLGTGIDPRELIRRYGADATRLSLLYQCGSSQDIRFDAEVVDNVLQDSPVTETCRNFCNKIWNAFRFVSMHLTDNSDLSLLDHPRNPTDLADRWILSQYNRVIITVTTSLENYRFDEASRALYEFVWNTYCDWYLELAKVRLNSQDPGEKAEVQKILVYVLEGTLRLLHPLVPFITEELWQRFPHRGDALIVADWPVADQSGLDEMAEKEMAVVQEVVGAIRNIRGTMSVPPGKPADVLVKVESKEILEILERTRAYICELGRVENLEMGEAVVRPQASASAVLNDLEIYVPLAGLIDLEIEQQRLQKEMGRLEKALTGLDKKLSNDRFLENAPPEVVEKERHRQSEYQSTLMRLQQNLEALS